jgi:hypothetical protein
MTFPWHLEVLMDYYGNERTYRVPTNGKFASVVLVFSNWELDAQQRLFKLTMKSNVFSSNGRSGGIGS